MTGKELNRWRKSMGWTVAETARQFMVPQSTLRDWIYDKRRTPPGYVVALTKALCGKRDDENINLYATSAQEKSSH